MLFPISDIRYPISAVLLTVCLSSPTQAQPAGRFPPDSLVNVKVIPKSTPVIQVIGTMRNFAGNLGVRCQFCHVGEEGKPLETFDFASDEKRNKLVARQMMLMLREVNARLDTIPQRGTPPVVATCATCHRGVSRPVPLFQIVADAALAANADSALRAYQQLRQRYYGRDAYDFSESALNIAAFRTGRGNKVDDALRILAYNETLYPNSSGMAVFRGNILLMKSDTNAAAEAFREAIRRDTTNGEARLRLQNIHKQPN